MNKKGFTLVEIIAVIVIMGILLLIVVPTTSNLMRSNEEKEYVTYYDIVQAGLEKYARTRRNEVGGTQDVGCIDDKNLADLIRLGYVKEFDQEDDIFCGTPNEFDSGLLSSWGVNTSKTYASMRVEGDHGKITTKLSLICVKMNEDGTYGEQPEYIKLIEVGPDCQTTQMYDPMEKFNIIYNYDGGTAPSTGVPAFYYFSYGETVNGVPTKSNYTFNGWNYNSSTKFEHVILSGESGEKTFTAKWCRNCAATGGASCSLDATSTPGTCTYTTSCPTGYTISNNGKYNAGCTPNVYTITYDYASGTAPTSGVPSSYTYGVGATINGKPTRQNYTFNGWNNGSTKAFSHTIGTNVTGNKSFTAMWCRNCAATGGASCTLNAATAGTCTYTTSCPANYTISNSGKYNPGCTPNSYSITYTYDGGTAPSSGVPSSYNVGVGATINGKPTRSGYTFNGWYNGSNTKMTQTIGTNETGNKSFTAKWCRNCAATGGASCSLNATSNPGTCTYTTSCPTGYTISNNGKYNPGCTANSYSITYTYDGGTAPSSGVPSSYSYGTGATINGKPTRSGYTFNGWYNGSTTAFTQSISSTSTGNKSFTAKWCRNCSPSGGASCSLNATSNPGACSYTTSCPTGYTISNSGKYNPVCTPNSYGISYNYDGGTAPSSGVPSSYTVGTGATISGKPTRNDYVFNGWYNGSTTKMTQTIGTSETGNKTFTAKWCRNCHPAGGPVNCVLNATSNPGSCSYSASCPYGYELQYAGTYHPKCELKCTGNCHLEGNSCVMSISVCMCGHPNPSGGGFEYTYSCCTNNTNCSGGCRSGDAYLGGGGNQTVPCPTYP